MSFTSINDDVLPAVVSPNGMNYDSDVEAEQEVDQLDSDSEPDNKDPDTTKPSSSSTKSTTKPGERVPGHSLLPASRLENMIQADGTTGNMAISKEGLFVLSIATEEFIKQFIQAGHREASAQRRNQINYSDMAKTARQYQEFMFLSDTVPCSISLQEAMQLREAKEREIFEDNPALAPTLPVYSHRPPSPELVPYPPPPPKSRRSNGTGSHSSKRARVSEPTSQGNPYPVFNGNEPQVEPRTNGGSSSHSRRSRNGASSSSHPTPSLNGHIAPPPPSSRSQASSAYPTPRELEMDLDPTAPVPPVFQEHSPPSHSPSAQGEDDSPWPYTTPATTGFNQTGSGPTFGRSTQNPGRTIYSQGGPD